MSLTSLWPPHPELASNRDGQPYSLIQMPSPLPSQAGVSEFLCKRFGHQLTEIRSPK